MNADTKLKLELNIDLPVLWSFCNEGVGEYEDLESSNKKGMEALEETTRSCRKLAELPLFHPEAERRMISVKFLPEGQGENSTVIKTYSITEYTGNTYLGGRSYSVSEVESM